jgi:8-oxo-dGTP pyrophosphatase MutT (NUDIX family)
MAEDIETKTGWQVVESEAGPDLKLFKVRFDWVENPRNGRRVKAVVLEAPDWVDVVALTPQGKIVVVCQHRLGVGHPTMEIPAGIIEPGETSEQAAKRELAEETGYTSTDWKYLGWVQTNPAFMSNRCHTWLARGVVQTGMPSLDEGEDIRIGEISSIEILDEIKAGRMRNVFALAALARVFDLRGAMDAA